MDVQMALELLEKHNRWRQGADIPMIQPKVLTEVINKIIDTYKK